jgi:hypothetical protein
MHTRQRGQTLPLFVINAWISFSRLPLLLARLWLPSISHSPQEFRVQVKCVFMAMIIIPSLLSLSTGDGH